MAALRKASRWNPWRNRPMCHRSAPPCLLADLGAGGSAVDDRISLLATLSAIHLRLQLLVLSYLYCYVLGPETAGISAHHVCCYTICAYHPVSTIACYNLAGLQTGEQQGHGAAWRNDHDGASQEDSAAAVHQHSWCMRHHRAPNSTP